jgi:hypothetical protein
MHGSPWHCLCMQTSGRCRRPTSCWPASAGSSRTCRTGTAPRCGVGLAGDTWHARLLPAVSSSATATFPVAGTLPPAPCAAPCCALLQGRDHIFMAVHDEAPCWVHNEVYNNSIMLTHWGRMDPNHESNTAYSWDNYSQPASHPEWQPIEWTQGWRGRPCYNPEKVCAPCKHARAFHDKAWRACTAKSHGYAAICVDAFCVHNKARAIRLLLAPACRTWSSPRSSSPTTTHRRRSWAPRPSPATC